MLRLVLAWLIGTAFGAYTVWLIYERKPYELWYDTLKWIIEDYYGGKVEADIKAGDCGVDFYPEGGGASGNDKGAFAQ